MIFGSCESKSYVWAAFEVAKSDRSMLKIKAMASPHSQRKTRPGMDKGGEVGGLARDHADLQWEGGSHEGLAEPMPTNEDLVGTKQQSGTLSPASKRLPRENTEGNQGRKRARASVSGTRVSALDVYQEITLKDLQAQYHRRLAEVAKDMNVSVARLLKKCREFGILRWPYRHVRSIQESIEQLEQEREETSHGEKLDFLERKLDLLRKKEELVVHFASCGLDAAMRKAIFTADPQEIDNLVTMAQNQGSSARIWDVQRVPVSTAPATPISNTHMHEHMPAGGGHPGVGGGGLAQPCTWRSGHIMGMAVDAPREEGSGGLGPERRQQDIFRRETFLPRIHGWDGYDPHRMPRHPEQRTDYTYGYPLPLPHPPPTPHPSSPRSGSHPSVGGRDKGIGPAFTIREGRHVQGLPLPSSSYLPPWSHLSMPHDQPSGHRAEQSVPHPMFSAGSSPVEGDDGGRGGGHHQMEGFYRGMVDPPPNPNTLYNSQRCEPSYALPRIVGNTPGLEQVHCSDDSVKSKNDDIEKTGGVIEGGSSRSPLLPPLRSLSGHEKDPQPDSSTILPSIFRNQQEEGLSHWQGEEEGKRTKGWYSSSSQSIRGERKIGTTSATQREGTPEAEAGQTGAVRPSSTLMLPSGMMNRRTTGLDLRQGKQGSGTTAYSPQWSHAAHAPPNIAPKKQQQLTPVTDGTATAAAGRSFQRTIRNGPEGSARAHQDHHAGTESYLQQPKPDAVGRGGVPLGTSPESPLRGIESVTSQSLHPPPYEHPLVGARVGWYTLPHPVPNHPIQRGSSLRAVREVDPRNNQVVDEDNEERYGERM